MFIWTGFDIGVSQHLWLAFYNVAFWDAGCMRISKDDAYYLKAWWMSKPMVHILPHWNWPGKEGQEIPVWTYSNCDEVELFINKKSLGKQTVQKDSHLEWKVPYQPGTLDAIGYKQGKKIITDTVETTVRLQYSSYSQ